MSITDITTSERHAHQQRVASLLDQLEAGRRNMYRLKAGGAQREGLRDLKHDLEETRSELLSTVA